MLKNFCHANLQGKNFKGQDLTETDFSYADLRGTNFTNATVKDANFSHAKCGLQFHQKIVLLSSSALISTLSLLVAAYSTGFLGVFLNKNENLAEYIFVVSITSIVLTMIFWAAIRQGIGVALAIVAITIGLAITTVAISNIDSNFEIIVLTRAFAFAGAAAGLVGMSIATAMTVAIASHRAIVLPVLTGLVGGLAGILAGRGDLFTSIAISVATIIVSTYIGWRAIAGDNKQTIIRKVAIALAAKGGTSFRNADLTNANFTRANLNNTDLRGANLTRTRFYEAARLKLSRVGDTILADLEVCALL